MKHIHERTGKTYEIGHIVDRENPNTTYEMTCIMYFGDDNESPFIVGYYFGGYSESHTDLVIDCWLLDREDDVNTLEGLNKYLYAYRTTNDGHLDKDTINELDVIEHNLALMLYSQQDRYYRAAGKKMDRHHYLLYVRDLYVTGKIDAKTRASLTALACNFEEE